MTKTKLASRLTRGAVRKREIKPPMSLVGDLYRDENTHNIYEERSALVSINAFVVLFFGRTNTRPSRWWHGLRTPRERNALRPQKQEMLLRRILPLYHARLGLVGGGQVRTLGMALSVCLRSYAESIRLWKEAGTDARPPNTRRLAATLITGREPCFLSNGRMGKGIYWAKRTWGY